MPSLMARAEFVNDLQFNHLIGAAVQRASTIHFACATIASFRPCSSEEGLSRRAVFDPGA
jgi:hypothetical protein